ncbi:hypothetical protein KBX06_03225 [Micromonospora sp. C31]|uniref:hypothetical protein n=1 Tax=Micromonospora sp. C31 TaxID=2824876 RepID=UPI001B37C1C7|nr:hypothetical protein [Micromonospora sp. C31]MBQ1072181.1 hypothetical protein [Micromonospora sp. C31]
MRFDVHLSVCEKTGQECFDLGLPDAEVVLLESSDERLTSGRTDATGRLTLSVRQAGPGRAVIKHPLIKDGRKEVELTFPAQGATLGQTIWTRLSEDAVPGG